MPKCEVRSQWPRGRIGIDPIRFVQCVSYGVLLGEGCVPMLLRNVPGYIRGYLELQLGVPIDGAKDPAVLAILRHDMLL